MSELAAQWADDMFAITTDIYNTPKEATKLLRVITVNGE